MIFNNIAFEATQSEVLGVLNCNEQSPSYDEVQKEYKTALAEAEGLVKLRAAAQFFEMPESTDSDPKQAIFLAITAGKEISLAVSEYFDKGNYLRAMLLDSLTDIAMFNAQERLENKVEIMAQRQGLEVRSSFCPSDDTGLSLQKKLCEKMDTEDKIGMTVGQNAMLSPPKSLCCIYLTYGEFSAVHGKGYCSECGRSGCVFAGFGCFEVKIKGRDSSKTIHIKKGESLSCGFHNHGIMVNTQCGGLGVCAKCKVRILEGNLPPSSADLAKLNPKELLEGIRLACCAYPHENLTIEILDCDDKDLTALTKYAKEKVPSKIKSGYGIAIDLGTTTIVMQLLDMSNSGIVDTGTMANPQSRLGSDVISRISAANKSEGERLRQLVCSEIGRLIDEIMLENSVNISEVAISGNTTMVHLMMGYSCEGMGRYPYKAENLDCISTTLGDLFPCKVHDVSVTILPAVSAFIGADILSGISICGIGATDGISLLVDIGTNKEAVIGGRDRLLACSTAAGPCFEGGNLKFGVASVPGAICKVSASKDKRSLNFRTIGNVPPIGICGTGAVEAVYELHKIGVISSTGKLKNEYCSEGYPIVQVNGKNEISLTQDDIRELQLAKSAIRAGIDTLIKRYETGYDDIERLYLAGSFGHYLNKDKAIGIGMLPHRLSDKIRAVGNTSLAGAVAYLCGKVSMEELYSLKRRVSLLDLAGDDYFNQKYLREMNF